MEPLISPLAKRLAEDNGIDWRQIQGTGDEGRITERDILNYLTRIMSGEIDAPEQPVDPVPPDWTGDEALGHLPDASEMSRVGVDPDLIDFAHQMRSASPENFAPSELAPAPPQSPFAEPPAAEEPLVVNDAEEDGADGLLMAQPAEELSGGRFPQAADAAEEMVEPDDFALDFDQDSAPPYADAFSGEIPAVEGVAPAAGELEPSAVLDLEDAASGPAEQIGTAAQPPAPEQPFSEEPYRDQPDQSDAPHAPPSPEAAEPPAQGEEGPGQLASDVPAPAELPGMPLEGQAAGPLEAAPQRILRQTQLWSLKKSCALTELARLGGQLSTLFGEIPLAFWLAKIAAESLSSLGLADSVALLQADGSSLVLPDLTGSFSQAWAAFGEAHLPSFRDSWSADQAPACGLVLVDGSSLGAEEVLWSADGLTLTWQARAEDLSLVLSGTASRSQAAPLLAEVASRIALPVRLLLS
jgi:hypothetical protein